MSTLDEPWAPITLRLCRHPRLADAEVEQPGATGYYVCAILWSLENATNGVIRLHRSGQVQGGCNDKQALARARALERHGRFEPNLPDGWLIHDFDEYQAVTIALQERKEKNRKRKAEWRAAEAAKAQNGTLSLGLSA